MDTKQIVNVEITRIVADDSQHRKSFPEDELQSLAESITAQGLIEPIIVRQAADEGFVIIAGERRFRAHQIAGLTHIPAIVREMDGKQAHVVQIIENTRRTDINPKEEAEG